MLSFFLQDTLRFAFRNFSYYFLHFVRIFTFQFDKRCQFCYVTFAAQHFYHCSKEGQRPICKDKYIKYTEGYEQINDNRKYNFK